LRHGRTSRTLRGIVVDTHTHFLMQEIFGRSGLPSGRGVVAMADSSTRALSIPR